MKGTQGFCSSCKSHRLTEVYRPNHESRLEIFNSVIAYHPSENPNLIYALLRAHRTFEDLGTFTLTRGLRYVRRMQLATEEQSHVQDTKGKSMINLIKKNRGCSNGRMLSLLTVLRKFGWSRGISTSRSQQGMSKRFHRRNPSCHPQ
jgi:hypothetical protein